MTVMTDEQLETGLIGGPEKRGIKIEDYDIAAADSVDQIKFSGEA